MAKHDAAPQPALQRDPRLSSGQSNNPAARAINAARRTMAPASAATPPDEPARSGRAPDGADPTADSAPLVAHPLPWMIAAVVVAGALLMWIWA